MAVVNLDLADIFEEAYDRAGSEMRGGYQLESIRRSLNIVTMEWANRGLNLWTIESGTKALTADTATHTLTETDTIDIIDMVVRDSSGNDYTLERISLPTYSLITDKDKSGRPTRAWIDRTATNTKVTIWPVPADSTYTLVYWRLSGIESISSGIGSGTNADMPARFVPALIAGLAFHVAAKMKKPDPVRVAFLEKQYEETFSRAAMEDRDRSSLHIVPMVR